MIAVHGVDYYEAVNINRRLMRYFYINKFMNGLIDKPQIKNELYRWRVDIDRIPATMSFHSLDFHPTLAMQNPSGESRIERNLYEQDKDFYRTVLENRAYNYSAFN